MSIYDVGSSDSIRFIAMELVKGQTLRQLLDERPLSIRSALTIADHRDGMDRKAPVSA